MLGRGRWIMMAYTGGAGLADTATGMPLSGCASEAAARRRAGGRICGLLALAREERSGVHAP